jgi:hypothetical protein
MFQMSQGLGWVLHRHKSTRDAMASGVMTKVLIKRWSGTDSGTRSVMNWHISTVVVKRVTLNVSLKELSTMARCIRHRGCTLPWGLMSYSESKCTNCARYTTLNLKPVYKIVSNPLKSPILYSLKRCPTSIWRLSSMMFSGYTSRIPNAYKSMETTLMT